MTRRCSNCAFVDRIDTDIHCFGHAWDDIQSWCSNWCPVNRLWIEEEIEI